MAKRIVTQIGYRAFKYFGYRSCDVEKIIEDRMELKVMDYDLSDCSTQLLTPDGKYWFANEDLIDPSHQ